MILKSDKRNAGIIGSPIKHSLSPFIHQYWMRQSNISARYSAYNIKREELPLFVKKAVEENFVGFNVTLPHKSSIIPFLDEVSKEAKALGAVNTVLIKEKRTLGFNTDTFGFIENLNRSIPKWAERKGSAVIIGAGGAARAVVWSLLEKNIYEIKIVNRSQKRALALILDMKHYFPHASLEYVENYESVIKNAILLVNASSLGMTGQPPLNIKLDLLNKNAIVYDLVYLPMRTDLIMAAEKLRLNALGGLGMLLYQAVPAFTMWYGSHVTVNNKLRKIILKQF